MKFEIPKITIYDRYMFKQVAMASLVAMLLFTIVWIAPEILLNTLKDALAGEYSMKTAVLLLFYELPKILDKAFPVSLLLGTIFTFDKMSLFFTALCFVTGDKGTPMAAAKMRAIRGSVRSTQYIYTKKDTTGHPLAAVIVSKSYDRKLNDVIVLDFSSHVYKDVHQLSNIYSAKQGYAYPDRWELTNVSNYKISPDGIYFDIEHLDKLEVLKGEDAENAFTLMTYSSMKERDITNANLKRYANLLKVESASEEYSYILNKYLQRYTHPLVCILLAILGCLLGFSKPREQRLVGFTIAIGCIFLYYITLPFFDLLAEKEILSPYITSTFPILAFSVAIYCFYKSKDL